MKSVHDPDKYAPIVDIGISLPKVRSLINDTCNAARATAVCLNELSWAAGVNFYGAEALGNMGPQWTRIMEFSTAAMRETCRAVLLTA